MNLKIIIPIAVIILAVGWWLGSPLFLDKVVDEPLPVSVQEETQELTPTQEEVPSSESETTEIAEEELEESESEPTPEVIEEVVEESDSYTGNFVDADKFHKGSGDVTVIDNILRFEDFSVTNGPDLKVYLATDDKANDFIDLGRLKGNKGNQNYEIPEGTDLEHYDTVLIWCKAFSVLFSTAELS